MRHSRLASGPAAVVLAAALTAAACGGGASPTGTVGVPTASLLPPATGTPAATALATSTATATTATVTPSAGTPSAVAVSSPVEGVLVKVDSAGLANVSGFTLRTDAGEELGFRLGRLENPTDFPPGHLAEHLATSSRVRVFFRAEGADLVVYRLEDAD